MVLAPARADFVGHGAPVRDVAISTDGLYAATTGFDDVAILWSVDDRTQLARFYGHEAAVNAADFLPPNPGMSYPRVVTVSDDGSGRIWDGDSGTLLHRLDGHSQKVVAIAAAPDGATVATASWDRTVRLWDADTGVELRVFEGHGGSVNDVCSRRTDRPWYRPAMTVTSGSGRWPTGRSRSGLPGSVSPSTVSHNRATARFWLPDRPTKRCAFGTSHRVTCCVRCRSRMTAPS